ncbi:signal transduction histidine kinase [Deinococcus metalli]|uniref:histidine kinase n=1 Tax=Deinococcus metalli TaxID=1141878 RepID=A0A7W8KEP6_9DEIO|nr:ATP-binding protein [Deinococcus metalli]MBB5376393.1 signal transduction histidine kinase [Deinococcus metalli]GHF44398.1 sensor histidine kinase [Deinococcus metalli]
MTVALLSVRLHTDQDVVVARRWTRMIAGHLGVPGQDQTRLATAVSELSRNAVQYAGGGQVDVQVQPAQRLLLITVSDHGPGIAALDDILAGRHVSSTGMGLGLAGARRMSDTFDVDSRPGHTVIRLGKRLPAATPVTPPDLDRVIRAVAAAQPVSPLQELRVQNRELLDALAALGHREEQLAALNQELENTNRGVVALYGELEEQAAQLREANRVQAMFLSYMSHEFRTPLSSILGLTRLLVERQDGDLSSEQERQVQLVQRSAGELLTMVDDLLDQARLRAGRSEPHLDDFEVAGMFAGLRALFQPLVSAPQVRLVFGPVAGLPTLHGDEARTTRILRNFISNALKFTAAGEVNVWAIVDGRSEWITLGVTDTGTGITAGDQARLFQDFSQVGPPGAGRGSGSGLGLSLARQFAEQLGGHVQVSSAVGEGSCFTVTLPVHVRRPGAPAGPGPDAAAPLAGPRVLLVDDTPGDRERLRALLAPWRAQTVEAASGAEGLTLVAEAAPALVLLDLSMPGMDGLAFLDALRAQPRGGSVPVLVVTAQVITPDLGARLKALDAAVLSKAQVFAGNPDALTRAVSARLGTPTSEAP